ncbi:hypothetical protein HW090_13130 [Pseudomonas sp. ABC1]|uniref:coiled-coil domain-containing protein n=1 Tax=Pseudomonas sp. ABC1 TaxID=2748080 RepID=UPI0015C32CBF|nr:hypothetical protein [Pseudomonas sp. ABC1]QLF94087.1 hypothetical protein HW090_13130 [Pseudomonas sp. ABC1]
MSTLNEKTFKEKITDFFKKLFSFEPKRNFFGLPIFRVTIGFFFGLAAIATCLIIVFSDLQCDLSYNGFNHAITIFKFPLGILAAAIPIIALLAANHKSEQTRETIRIASSNNNFTNYHKHISEFEVYIEKHHDDNEIKIKSLRDLHKTSFPNARNGDYGASELLHGKAKFILKKIEILNDVQEEVIKKREEIEAKNSGEKYKLSKQMDNLKEEIIELNKKLNSHRQQNSQTKESPQKDQTDNEIESLIDDNISAQRKILSDLDKISEKTNGPLNDNTEKYQKAAQSLKQEIIAAANTMGIKKSLTHINKDGTIINTEHDILSESTYTMSPDHITSTGETVINFINLSLRFDDDFKEDTNINNFMKIYKTSKHDSPAEKYKEYKKYKKSNQTPA